MYCGDEHPGPRRIYLTCSEFINPSQGDEDAQRRRAEAIKSLKKALAEIKRYGTASKRRTIVYVSGLTRAQIDTLNR
jgi:hypothetical protein